MLFLSLLYSICKSLTRNIHVTVYDDDVMHMSRLESNKIKEYRLIIFCFICIRLIYFIYWQYLNRIVQFSWAGSCKVRRLNRALDAYGLKYSEQTKVFRNSDPISEPSEKYQFALKTCYLAFFIVFSILVHEMFLFGKAQISFKGVLCNSLPYPISVYYFTHEVTWRDVFITSQTVFYRWIP